VEVVSHIEEAGAMFGQALQEHVQGFSGDDGVKGRGGFVGNQEVGIVDQGARDRYALALAAGEGSRPTTMEGRFHAAICQSDAGLLEGHVSRLTSQVAEHLAHCFESSLCGVKGGARLLPYLAEAALYFALRSSPDVGVQTEHRKFSSGGYQKTADSGQHSGLTGPAFPHENKGLGRLETTGEIVEAERLPGPIPDADLTHIQECDHPLPPASRRRLV
jgi:hypothetical protein